MLDQAMIDRYLHDVDAHLHVDRAHRKRILDEIEGHLHDAVEAHVARGAEPEHAIQQAIAELGPPDDVAVQFSPLPSPARSVRSWRRWAPIAVPGVLLAMGVAMTAWSLAWLSGGLTLGEQVAQRQYFLWTGLGGALTAGTFIAIRRGDRDPAWRIGAWFLAALTGAIVGLSVIG